MPISLPRSRVYAALTLASFLATWAGETALAANKTEVRRHKFKNLPSIATTRESTWTVTEETNIFNGSAFANATVDYGFKHGWNLGLSLLNVGLWQSGGNRWDPDVLVNLEKTFAVSRVWSAVIGTQNGAGFWDSQRKSRVESYSYLDNQLRLERWGISGHVGGYIASEGMTGPGDRSGFMAGIQLPLIGERLQLGVEYVSGDNALAVGTIQLYWQVAPHWRLDIGAQWPAPRSPNDYAGLVGISWH